MAINYASRWLDQLNIHDVGLRYSAGTRWPTGSTGGGHSTVRTWRHSMLPFYMLNYLLLGLLVALPVLIVVVLT